MEQVSTRLIIITGLPGVGKTTIVKKLFADLCPQVSKSTTRIRGFYTEDCRNDQHQRIGFNIEQLTVDGTKHQGVLARVASSATSVDNRHMVGKYAVNVIDFERVALPMMESFNGIYLIDEIGKMELLSEPFKLRASKLLQSNSLMIVTAPSRCGPMILKAKEASSTVVYDVTKSNRDSIYKDILKTAQTMISFNTTI